MDGGAMRNLKMFRKLCGEDPMKNVVIASTFWGVIPDNKAIAHEEELCSKDDFWGDMVEHGASVKRFAGDQKSALDIILSLARKPAVTLDIQRELVDEDKPIGKTAAGNAVNEELHRLEEKYKGEIKRFQEETAAAMAEKDVKLERVLKKEREKMERKLDRIHGDQEMLRKERREEIRRVEEENERRFQLLKKEYDSKMEKQQLASERVRAEDRASFRETMGELHNQNATLNSTFKQQMRELQSANEAALAAAAAAQQPQRDVGGKFANLLVTGTLAALDPLAIPVALASLVDLVNEL
jgi:hypothetical protein